MRGVLLTILLIIPALFAFGCVSSNEFDYSDAEPTPFYITTTGAGRNYQLNANGTPGLSYLRITSGLHFYADAINPKLGLEGADEGWSSENPVFFSSKHDVSSEAFSDTIELLVSPRIYRLYASLVLTDNTKIQRYLELPTDESRSWIDNTDKVHIKMNAGWGTVFFEAWIGQDDSVLIEIEDEDEFIKDVPEIESPPIEPAPTDSDEDPVDDNSDGLSWPKRHCITEIGKPYIEGQSVWADLEKYREARAELINSLRAVIEKSGRKVTGCIVHFDSSGDTPWGAFFLAIGAGAELDLKYPVGFSWTEYNH
ncbi:MAG: hypothetical protein L3J82_06035 [Planctomycetes bacterium]|nr:hypothetical protein [Planctomycetota bacterium]